MKITRVMLLLVIVVALIALGILATMLHDISSERTTDISTNARFSQLMNKCFILQQDNLLEKTAPKGTRVWVRKIQKREGFLVRSKDIIVQIGDDPNNLTTATSLFSIDTAQVSTHQESLVPCPMKP